MLLIGILFAVVWTADSVEPMQFELTDRGGMTNELVLEQSCKPEHNFCVEVDLGHSYKISLRWVMAVLTFLTQTHIISKTDINFATNSLSVFLLQSIS